MSDAFREENPDRHTEADLEEVLLRPPKRHREQSDKGNEVAIEEVLEDGNVVPFRIDRVTDFDNPIDRKRIIIIDV